ncbi:MAG: formylglycine-generating enzyme family protein [SAR324 cluster bacterium]|nr:formylglycine-generating enzyme family protein [SAR324 cluster bacterium]
MSEQLKSFFCWLLLIVGVFFLVSNCAEQNSSGGISGIKLPNPEDEDEEEQIATLTIDGIFVLGTNANPGRTPSSRFAGEVLIRLYNQEGRQIAEDMTDSKGRFELASTVLTTDLPLVLKGTFENMTYSNIVGRGADPLTAHINEVTTAISEKFLGQRDQSQENLTRVIELVMIQRFGIEATGESKLPLNLFIDGNFADESSIGHLILNAAARNQIDLREELQDHQTVFSNAAFIASLSAFLRAQKQPETALKELEQIPGSSLQKSLLAIANASNAGEAQQKQTELLASAQEVSEQLIAKIGSLIDSLGEEILNPGEGVASNTTSSVTTSTLPSITSLPSTSTTTSSSTSTLVTIPTTTTSSTTSTTTTTITTTSTTTSSTTTSTTTTTVPLLTAQSLGMILLSGGSFQMGDISGAGNSDESPIHTVSLSSFYIADHEVTLGEYRNYDSSHSNHSQTACDTEECPVTGVSWNDAQNYITWLNSTSPSGNGTSYRFCTESEWEYAARAETTSRWSCGSKESCLPNVAWYSDNSENQAHEVKSKSPNSFNLYDMHGNVFEWVQDWYDSSYYSSSASNDPDGPDSGSNRVLRGGSYSSSSTEARSAYRKREQPASSDQQSGFRLCSS